MAIELRNDYDVPGGSAQPVAVVGWPGRRKVFAKALELWLPAGVLILLALACFVWPLIYTIPTPTPGSLLNVTLPPFSAHHLLGTDPLGNDVMSEILYGGRV